MTEPLDRLYRAVVAAQTADPAMSRTARLLRSGRGKMAKKLAEEAVEVVIDAMNGQTEAVVAESADLLYNLVVLWVAMRDRSRRGLGRDGPPRAAVRHRREAAEGHEEPAALPRRKVVALPSAAAPASSADRIGRSDRSQARRDVQRSTSGDVDNPTPASKHPACSAASTTGASPPPESRTRRG